MVTPLANNKSTRHSSTALTTQHPFTANGVTYVWSEGPGLLTHRAVLRTPAKRERAYKLFVETLLPQFDRAQLKPLVSPAKSKASLSARWLCWTDPKSEAPPVWALVVDAATPDATHAIADNDTGRVVAWGDGPALAWADAEAVSLGVLRDALHEPPPWLVRGLASMDAEFPVQITVRPPFAKLPSRAQRAVESASMPVRRAGRG
jgi:hypothetical protein